MGKEGVTRPHSRRRAVVAAVTAASLTVLFVAGLTFANSIGAAQVAANAASLHWANTASGVSGLTRAALAQAVTFAELQSRGLTDLSDLDFALEQVEMFLSELRGLEATAGDSPSLPALVHFRAGVERAHAALAAFDNEAAFAEIDRLEESYQALVAGLRAEQDLVQEAIAANTDASARVNGYLVFILTLAIPAAAVVVYWRIARRQVGELRTRTEMELEAERSLGRAKDAFIAGLSHELRTPLTSVYGFAEVLGDEGAEHPDQVRELAGIIATESAELTRMVDDLLVASRLDSTGVEIEASPTRVASVVESALSPFLRGGVEVRWEPGRQMVSTDAARLRQVLVNLISNAVRHGGPAIGIEVSSAEDTVEIEVWDDGPGVPEDRVDRLFERFAHAGTAPLLTGSVGLGLAVASSLAGRLGGSLRYQRFGGRTYFVVALPAYAVTDAEPEGAEVPETEPAPVDEEPSESISDVIRALSS